MKGILLILLLGISGVAVAQAPAAAEPEVNDPVQEQPQLDAENDAENDAEEDGASHSADSADPLLAGPETLVEEDPAIEASAEEEFNPDEEISEDYPVPLPSDI